MHKLVYLFELDSTRNSEEQMESAMKALYREIVMNGNTVAITFNQLIDSRFFLSLLNDDKWSDSILKLFQSGGIRISQYGQFRTPSQYLIHQALDSNEDYIFSGLPIRSNQKSLIALVKRSLMYSDMTELNEYINGMHDEELPLLFREQEKKKVGENTKVLIRQSTLDKKEIMNTLKDLRVFLNLVLKFSDLQNAYNPPKNFSADKEGLTLYDFITYVKKFKSSTVPEWNGAIELLTGIVSKTENKNKRSAILKRIYSEYKDTDQSENKFRTYALAQAIVNLCYNYACEASISNVSRHYDIDEFKDSGSEYPTFEADFFCRLKQYYGKGKNWKNTFLTDETNDFTPYQFKTIWFFNLKRAVHLAEHASVYKEENKHDDQLLPYEYKLFRQRLLHRFKILFGVGRKLLLTVSYLAIAFYIEQIVYDFIENKLYEKIKVELSVKGTDVITSVIALFISAAIVQWLSDKLSKCLKREESDYPRQDNEKEWFPQLNIPTFGESLENLISQLGDFICALFSFTAPYMNWKNLCRLHPKERDEINRIVYVSDDILNYKKYRNELSKGNHLAWMFEPSEQLPMIDILKKGEDIRLTRIEEMTGKKYGLVYQSPYHRMIVDPMEKSGAPENGIADNNVYPYERLAGITDQPGIVAVPVIRKGGKTHFVLLRQFRHAIRREQINFPRGFGEEGIDKYRNTQKELWEEIKAVLKDPVTNSEIHYNKNPNQSDDPVPALTELAEITIDSGCQCSNAVIMQAELSSYKASRGHEGISNCIEADEEELEQLILDRSIDDSFTIEAFYLYKMHRDSQNGSQLSDSL